MKLNQIRDNAGATHARKRVGRGIGSGLGKTSGKGHKGQKARSGVAIKGFEGGQMPIHRRVPKRGFNNVFAKSYQIVNLAQLQAAVEAGRIKDGETVTAKSLAEAGLIRRTKDGIRVLGRGEIKAKLQIEAAGASKSAIAAIEKAGGTITVLAPAPVADTSSESA
ncbi:MAG: 50S ribosomal protein L15 [Alphaproteobacteria bacterium]